MMLRLLVSVRSAGEARVAVAGGADIIDVKEPVNGSLGRADAGVIAEVVDAVGGQVPVSAALGEWVELRDYHDVTNGLAGLAFAKVGLAGCAGRADWREGVKVLRASAPAGIGWVAVAYADWRRARAPSVEEVLDDALHDALRDATERRCVVMLIDTFVKDGRSLLDWMGVDEIAAIVKRAHGGGLQVALAGSLKAADLGALAGTGADIFAVRSAACAAGDRCGEIDAGAVRRLAEIIGAGAGIGARTARCAG